MAKKYTKNQDVIDKDYGGKLLLFDINESKMSELNSVAKLLWEKSGTSFDLADLTKIVNENCFDVGDIEKDLEDFIKVALKNNLIKDAKN